MGDLCEVLESLSKDKQYSSEARSTLVVVRNSMVVRLGRIRPHWKSMAGVVPTKKEVTMFRLELVAGIRDEFPRQFEKARLKAEEREKRELEKGKGRVGEDRAEGVGGPVVEYDMPVDD